MSYRDKALLLLYHSRGPIAESKLFRWVEHSKATLFRRDVIRRAHKNKLVEYDAKAGTIEISPLGINYVEASLLN